MRFHCRRCLPVAAVFALTIATGGCSGLDDLQINNQYAFLVRVRYGGKTVGGVPARSTRLFPSAGSYRGGAINETTYENAQGVMLGRLNDKSLDVQRQNVSRFNGTAVWVAVIGPGHNTGL